MSYKILMVDDDPAVVDPFRRAFAEAGHELIATADAAEALDLFARVRPDVMLVAEGSPDIPAAAISRRVKETELGRNTPVVVMATDLPSDRLELTRRMQVFACDLIVARGAACELLLDMIRKLMDAAPAPKPERTAVENTQPTLASLAKSTNRDSPSAEAFDATVPGPSRVPPGRPGGDSGNDIQEHLDSLFGESAEQPAALPAPITPPVERRRPPAVIPGTPVVASDSSATRRPRAERGSQAVVAESGSPEPVRRPADEAQSIRRSMVRQAPKAVEQLRQPRVHTRPLDLDRRRSRWVLPVAVAGGLVVLGGGLLLGFGLLRGSDPDPNSAAGRVVRAAPTFEVESKPEPEALPVPPPIESEEEVVEPAELPVEEAPEPQEPREPQEPETETIDERPEPVATPAVASAIAVVEPPQPASEPEPEPEPEPNEAPTEAPPPGPPVIEAEPEPVEPARESTPVVAPPAFQPVIVLERVDPSYSAKALKGIEATEIMLRVQVDSDGRIARVLVDEGIPGSQLEAAAVSAVLRWKFRPATKDGVPTKSWTTVRFPIEP